MNHPPPAAAIDAARRALLAAAVDLGRVGKIAPLLTDDEVRAALAAAKRAVDAAFAESEG